MSILFSLAKIYNDCQGEFEKQTPGKSFSDAIRFGTSQNFLALCDNLDLLKLLAADKGARKPQFIYIDPPFSSGADYNARVTVAGAGIRNKAYGDRWEDGLEGFLSMLCLRLLYMKEVLAENGVIAVHLDRRAVHYVKVLMDEIFGQEHFVNELIWTYKSGGASKRSFSHKHDTILVYSKGDAYTFNPGREISYNRGGKPYKFKGVEEFRDEYGRWYTLVNRKDVIAVDMVGRTSSERTGYATQKPEALLRILIESFTDPGDLCADFFCGSGTLAAGANSLGRDFTVCDAGAQAVENSMKRLYRAGASFTVKKGELDFAPANAEAELAGGELLLRSYTRRIDSLKLSPSQKEKLRESRRRNRLALLDFYICGNTDSDGVFRVCPAENAGELMAFDAFGGCAKINLKTK